MLLCMSIIYLNRLFGTYERKNIENEIFKADSTIFANVVPTTHMNTPGQRLHCNRSHTAGCYFHRRERWILWYGDTKILQRFKHFPRALPILYVPYNVRLLFFFVFIYLYKMHPMIVTTKIHVYYVSGSFYSHFLRFTRHFFHGASMWAERRKKRLPANRVELLLTIASVAINSTNAQNIYTTFFSSFIEYQHSATHFFLLHISSTRSAGTFCLLPECYLCRFSRIQCAMNSFILSRSSVRCNNETMRHTLQRRKKANKKKRNLQTCSGTRQCIFIRIDSEGHRISTLCWKIQ